MELYLPDLREGYVHLLLTVVELGYPVVARALPTTELTNVTLVFPDTLQPLLPVNVGRRVNLRLAAVEALQLVAGVSRPALLRRASPTYDRVLVDPTDLDYGSYGPRLAAQLDECVALLRADPGTRRAVVAIWREEDLTHVGDRPCTLVLQFLVRPPRVGEPPELELHVTMRSQDVWLGTPYDVFAFTQLQHSVARDLRLPAGRYVHNATSLHLYDHDAAAARAVITDWGKTHRPAPDDLPLGVVALDPDESAGDVAYGLLDELASDAERAVNPWYAAQLERLRRTAEDDA